MSDVSDALSMLNWDYATMMPEGAAAARARQLSALKLICHEMITDPAMGELLDAAESETEALGQWQNANLAGMRRAWVHANAIPANLVARLSDVAAECEVIWRSAREDNDFAALAPTLATLLDLRREAAGALSSALGCSPYDALLDSFDPGTSMHMVDRLFDDLEPFLRNFLPQVLERQQRMPAPVEPEGPFPIASQRAVATTFMQALGFDFHYGRLDVSHHPFSGGVPEDARITTRYSDTEFLQGLMAVLHETGHALYSRGLPQAWRGQPVGEALGMTLHESQSLSIEMQTCRGPDFLGYAAPHLQATFGGDPASWSAENLRRLCQRVAPSLIRVYADEVTYPLHIILRYRLERAMISGDLSISDLPGAWNEGMRELLGIVPPDDRDGCMQDVHWAAGLFGYFPTYTMGALAAAQFAAAARRDRPEIPQAVARGEFTPLTDWLRENVHQAGSRYSTDELLQRATGAPLGTAAFKAHLQARYLPD